MRFHSRMAWEVGWRGVELRHLVALQAVAAERSFSAAAQKLGYTQSAVSGQIIALERALGVRLFERIRGTRPVQLTPEGEILLAHAAAITARLDTAQAEIAALCAGVPRGAVRIGSFQTASRTLIPEAFSRLSGEDTAADIVLTERFDLDALLDDLEHGKLDLAFTVLPLRGGPFDAVEVHRDEHVLIVPADHPHAHATAISLEELGELEVIALEGCRTQAATETAIAALGRPLKVGRRIEDAPSILAFVSAGLGIGFMPSLAATDLPADLVAVPLDRRVPPRVIAIAWHTERPLAPRAARFVELARDAGATMTRRNLAAA